MGQVQMGPLQGWGLRKGGGGGGGGHRELRDTVEAFIFYFRFRLFRFFFFHTPSKTGGGGGDLLKSAVCPDDAGIQFSLVKYGVYVLGESP